MWLLGTLGGIAKGIGNATKKSFEFGIDIAEEVVGIDDEYDGVWGTVWGSWNDNILGAAGEEGAVQHLFGEEGAGGRFFGMIPEGVRKPAKHVITPVFEGLDLVYEHVIDRPLGTYIGATQQGAQSAWDALTGKAPPGDVFTIFDPSEWAKAYQITGSRSTGQALALMTKWIDLDNPAEVKRFEGTGFYKMYSGIWDALGNIILDPANLAFGAGLIGTPGRLARKGARMGATKLNPAFALKTMDEAIASGKGFARFEEVIEGLRYEEDLKWSLEYMSGRGFTADDLAHIDTLTTRIMESAGKGSLGHGAKKLTPGQARAIASLPNKEARHMWFRLVTTGGDAKVMDEMDKAAKLWAQSHQENGLHHKLEDILQWQTNANSEEISAFLVHEQRRLENLLMDQNPNLPFGAALSIKEERLRALGRRNDIRRDFLDPDELNGWDDVLNETPHLVSAAADQVLLQNSFDTMRFLPDMGRINEIGIATKGAVVAGAVSVQTVFEKMPLLGDLATIPQRTLRIIKEKVPQGIIVWDDPRQGFVQFQRMLRDAGRILDDKGIGIIDKNYADSTLGKWTSYSDINAQKKLFVDTVDDINGRLVDSFLERLMPDELALNSPEYRAWFGKTKSELTQKLQRQYKAGQDLTRSKSKNARIYGNKQIRIDHAYEGGEIISRYLPITPQQLEQSSLIPRYDLYRQAFEDGGIVAKTFREGKRITANSANAFTSVWKKGVLMRPAWPMRVLIDEYARAAAEIGTLETLKSIPAAYNDLRATWFRNNDIDLGPLLRQRIVDDLDIIDTGEDYGSLVARYLEKTSSEDAQKMVQNVIYDEYGKKRILRRSLGASVGLGIVAGPIGLAGAGVYSLYMRGALRRAAQMEVGTSFGFQLRTVARGQLSKEIGDIKRSVRIPDGDGWKAIDDPVRVAAATEEIRQLNIAADLLETHAQNLEKGQQLALDFLKEKNVELYDNFDRAGLMLDEAGMSNISMNGYMVGNAYGNNPQQMAIYRNSVSSDSSTRTLYESLSQSERRKNRFKEPTQLDYDLNGVDNFAQGWNSTVNHQFIPTGDDFANNAFQDFTRLIWSGADNHTVLRWMRTDQGDALRYAMPHYFGEHAVNNKPNLWNTNGKGPTDDFDYLGLMRKELNSLIPDVPEFAHLRQRAAQGGEVNWLRDVQPILENNPRFAGKSMNQIRRDINEVDFGKVISDSVLKETERVSGILNRVHQKIDSIFTNIGTMPTDILTRSLIFKTAYSREMSRRIASMSGPDGKFLLKESDIRRMEREARSVSLGETRDLMYDLAERSRFEEIVSNIMPFYGAWQEVITRWTGLAARNPAFVMAGTRNFHKGMENFDGLDEEGNRQFVIQLPEGMMNWKIPVLGVKAFGKMSALGESAINFNFGSASMISAGMPGFGPLVSIAVSETTLKLPEIDECVSLINPFGPEEGEAFLERAIQQVLPTWVKKAASTQFDTAARQRTKARLTGDLAQEYYLAGEVIDTEQEWKEFEDEIDRRATALLTVRMVANLGLPVQMIAQSPHYKIITGYRKVQEEKGLESADEWLIIKHPEMWAILGRQTAVRTVASATLEGEKNYQKYKDFADEHPEIADFVVGKVGALDVGFEYNRAVQIKEINEGRRDRLDPREIYTRGAESVGWYAYRDMMAPINKELTRRSLDGLSASLNATSNEDLAALKRASVEEIALLNPQWKEEFDQFKSADEKAVVFHAFRAAVEAELFDERPEMVQVKRYIEMRDMIATELERRGGRNKDFELLSVPQNNDLKELWLRFRLEIRQVDDFIGIYTRYFEHDNSISRASWPTSWMIQKYQKVA